MTPEEHYLVMALYARQNFKFNTLFDALTAAGVIQEDDLLAYRQYTLEEKPEEIAKGMEQAWKAYQAVAASLGITTGLENGPIPPKKA